MIRLFSHTETDFTHNGIHVLDDIALGDTCILSNGINEVYSLEMEVSIYNNSKWTDIESEMILKVPTPKGEQLFRIKEVVKGFSTIKIYGKHIFFDLENNFILDTNIVKKDGRSAIAQILGAMTNNMVNSFHGTSDISNFNNSRLVRKNVVTALIGDDDNSFLNRWGGELELNNFNFSINQRIGSDRGFQIRYGKNATGYEGNINTYNLCTRIVPVGFDGLMLEGTKWVDSPNIAKYPQIYTYEVKFEDIKVKENEDDEEGYNTIEEAREALREAAVNYFTSTECDLPSFSAIVNFITLRNTEEFKNVKALETVALGDDVSIYLSNIDVNASSRVVREKWNFFTKKHVELEIGEIKPNVFKQLINIKDTIDNIVESLGGNTWQDIINKSLDEATKLMEEGLKGSHVITMKNQIVIGDAPDIKDMVNCIVFNKNGIGFSNNGYLPDRLVSAMTIDGKINASCITTGELNAALIKTGVLMSANGKTWIDMDNGTFNFADKIKYDGEKFEIELGDVSVNLVNNGSFNNGIEGWNKFNITIRTPSFYNSERNWCNFYTTVSEGERYGENIFDILPNKVYNFSMLLAQYSTSKTFYRIRVETKNKNSDAWTVIKEFTGNTSATRSKPEQLSYSFKSASTVEKCRIWIGKLDGETFDIYVSDLFMGTGTIYARKSEFEILDTKISSKVSEDDFGTLVEQNAHAVKIAWNNNSKYVQFESGGLAIYNGAVNKSQKRAFFDERGNHFWRDGYYVGKIGTNQYADNTAIKGINFDLEYQGGYMTWAVKKTSAASTYTMMWSYANKTIGNYEAGKLHAGCDIDMHNYTLRNVNFEGGGINGTLMFTQIVGMNSDGTANRWYNNSKLVFQNGILIDATWGNA